MIYRPGRPALVGKAFSFTNELSFLFHQYTALSSRTVDGHQMYSGGSVIGKEISPTPPLIFTGGGGQKVRNWRRFQYLHNEFKFEAPAFDNSASIQTLKQTSCLEMIGLCPCQVW